MKRSHGGNSKHSRNLVAPKKKVTVSRKLALLPDGARVRIKVNPQYLAGRVATLRFNNKIGTVAGKQGNCYVVDFKDGNKPKQLVIANVHLERML